MDGVELLKELNERYGNAIELLAGSGMNADNAEKMFEMTGITQIHSSCKGIIFDTTTSAEEVSYQYNGCDGFEAVDKEKVKAFVEAVNKFSNK